MSRADDRLKIRDETYREPKRTIKACITCKWRFQDYDLDFCCPIGRWRDRGTVSYSMCLWNLLAVCDLWESDDG